MKEINIQHPNVLFSIEVLKRDLLSRLMVAEELTKSGITCIFIPQYILVNCLKQNAFKYFSHLMLKSCQGFMFTEYLKKYERENLTISSLDEELFSVTTSEYISSRHNEIGLRNADKIFCANQEEFDWLNDNYSAFSEKFIKTGNPRSDLFFNCSESDKKKSNPDLFFLSSFPSLTRSMRETEITESYRIKYRSSKDRSYKNELFNELKRLIDINEEGKKLPIKRMIMRPHPKDNLRRLKRLCKSTNISIEDSLLDVVSHCNRYDTRIIHFGSSSSLELYAKNINSNFVYSKKLLEKYNLVIPHKIYECSNCINIDNKNFSQFLNLLVLNKSKNLNFESNISKLIAEEIIELIKKKRNFKNSELITLSSLLSKFNLLKISFKTLLGKNKYAYTKCRKLTKNDKELLKEIFPNIDLNFLGEIIIAKKNLH